MIQNEITKPSDLLDKRGALIQTGWAKKPLLRYNRENIPVPFHRIKEWEHYTFVHKKKYAMLVTVGDIGYFTLLGTQFMDFSKRKAHVVGGLNFFTRGKTQLPHDSMKGDTVVKGSGPLCIGLGGMNFAIKRFPDKRVFGIDYPLFKGLKARIIMYQDPKLDSMVVVTPFKEDHRQFYYNHKLNLNPCKGWIEFDKKKIELNVKDSYWGLDWGKGVWPYKTHWLWGTGAGRVDGHDLWFNIGYGFGDRSDHTENMIFYDGVCHKTDQVTFHIDKKRPGSPWKFTSNDGRIELVLKPAIRFPAYVETGIIMTKPDTVWGYYSGHVILDDGKKIEIKNFLGHAEDIHFRW